ncbi:eCIS core domain-containing protein [Pseudomonas laurentiana]|uniref:DUF4157 domain-containing protein n=1 Tax=Pseudomonas laurentiana TaxID=2364649 RepID=A0A6I5RTJ5_9PSED|nr:DUF4157 domain-containing protein [Pseudomonas laurentiana]
MPAASLRTLGRSMALSLILCSPLLASGATTQCPTGQYQVCMGSCFCAPVSQTEIGTVFAQVGQIAATGLAGWIKQSRNSAAAGDVQPIPLNIRVQLEPYYDFQVLDSARYKVGDTQELNAANAMLQNPDVNAVTLMDIIVFRHEQDALNNVALWAHELKHVQQYQQWGVDDFAARYTRDYDAVEAPAYKIQADVAKTLGKHGS